MSEGMSKPAVCHADTVKEVEDDDTEFQLTDPLIADSELYAKRISPGVLVLQAAWYVIRKLFKRHLEKDEASEATA
jgi:hypothetical protein